MEICYEDSRFVIAVKPVGLDSETEFPRALEAQLGGTFFPIHRLDKNVGGLMVYARTREAAAELSKAVQAGSMVKEYLAQVHGTVPETGDWEDLLWKDSRKNKVFVVKRPRAGVREAKLSYKVLVPGERSLVRVHLYTGRSHQIRVQFASRGYPLVGDHKYGSRAKEETIRLFSAGLKFPWKGKEMAFTLEPDWVSGLQ